MLARKNINKENQFVKTLSKEDDLCRPLSKLTDSENLTRNTKIQKLNKNQNCAEIIEDLDEHLPLLVQNLRTLLKGKLFR